MLGRWSEAVLARGVGVAGVVNINELLDGHVTLDLECLDRIYLNAYVPSPGGRAGGDVPV